MSVPFKSYSELYSRYTEGMNAVKELFSCGDVDRDREAADRLYDRMTFADCWAYPWLTLFEIALIRGDFNAARRWIARGRDVMQRLPDHYGRSYLIRPV